MVGERCPVLHEACGGGWSGTPLVEGESRFLAALGAGPDDGTPYLAWSVREHTDPGAPLFAGDDCPARENRRWVEDDIWDALCRGTGLGAPFCRPPAAHMRLQDRMGVAPGAEESDNGDDLLPLTEEDHAALAAALARWRSTHPASVPGWGEGRDPALACLVWLAWWTRWALDRCVHPVLFSRAEP